MIKLKLPLFTLVFFSVIFSLIITIDFCRFFFSSLPTDGTYLLKPGQSVQRVLHDLKDRDLIHHRRDSWYLKLYLKITQQESKLQAGEYRFSSQESIRQLLNKMLQGDVIHYKLKLIEGWNMNQIWAALKHPAIEHRLQKDNKQWAWLACDCEYHDGLFFPDTYYFTRGASDRMLLQRAHTALLKRLQVAWEQRATDLPYDSPYQALIAASLIEKETQLDSERPIIAGVIIRRLERGMRLQFDPTVIYALGEKFDGNITKSNLRVDSPFNTYRHKGLPPAPIALAGTASIYAALHPDSSNIIYFVAKGDGSHAFSSTIDEHNRLVRKYQLT